MLSESRKNKVVELNITIGNFLGDQCKQCHFASKTPLQKLFVIFETFDSFEDTTIDTPYIMGRHVFIRI